MRCRAGDLAVVIRAQHPENIGRLVSVVERCYAQPCSDGRPAFNVDGDLYDPDGYTGVVWIVESLGSPFRSCNKLVMRAPAKDTSLRPLRDDEDDLTEINAETLDKIRNLEITV